MRDDQVLTLIRKECAHTSNITMLGDQQSKLGLEAVMAVICERGSIIRTFLNPAYFERRFNEVYTEKAAAFNEKIKTALTKEKLKI